MIYILVDSEVWEKRCSGEVLLTESIAVELIRNDVKCKIISQKMFMDMVDNYVYPSSDSDKIYVRTLNLEILNASKKLEARGFNIINSCDTLNYLRDFSLLNKKMIENDIPTVFLHDQIFAKENFDRSRAFGQNLSDFLVEYIKEYNIQSFYLRTKNFNICQKMVRKTSYIKDRISENYLWMIFECPDVVKYTRSRVIDGKYVKDSTISSDKMDLSNHKKFKNDSIEILVNKVSKAINLEIGNIDIVVDSSNNLKVFSCFENSYEYVNDNYHHIKISEYLMK